MKIVTLLENTACRPGLRAARGLSLYVETRRHRILFDMGPDPQFLDNARELGIDLSTVDVAVLSHGHSDHGGGLATAKNCAERIRQAKAVTAYISLMQWSPIMKSAWQRSALTIRPMN